MYRESEFQIRFEAFNVLNHALLYGVNTGVPNTTVGGGNASDTSPVSASHTRPPRVRVRSSSAGASTSKGDERLEIFVYPGIPGEGGKVTLAAQVTAAV